MNLNTMEQRDAKYRLDLVVVIAVSEIRSDESPTGCMEAP